MTSSESVSSESWWVEDLFPPFFSLELNEAKDESKKKKDLWNLVKRVYPLDSEEVKAIYERVLLMVQAAEELKNRSHDPLWSWESKGATEKHDTPTTPLEAHIESKRKISDEKHSPALWNTQELKLLRKAQEELKSQNCHLRMTVETLTTKCSELENLVSMYKGTLEKTETENTARAKEIQRLDILNKNLKEQLEYESGRCYELSEDLQSLQQAFTGKEKICRELGEDLKKMELLCKFQQSKLDGLESDAEERFNKVREILKSKYESEVMGLVSRLNRTAEELDYERLQHEQTKCALKVLQTHFSGADSS